MVWLVLAGVASAQPGEVLWLGHSAFRITSSGGKVIVIDPFLTKNPRTPVAFLNCSIAARKPSGLWRRYCSQPFKKTS